jgi:hypothetical protein
MQTIGKGFGAKRKRVTSRDASDQLYNSLYEAVRPFGIEVRTISGNDGSPSSLETLLAISPETVIAFLESILTQHEKEDLERDLKTIRSHADFSQSVSRLMEVFSNESLGSDHWRFEQNEWLVNRFCSKDTQSAFGQSINFAASGIKLIERTAAWKKFDEWWDHWSKYKQPFALLGEEGDGKTWAIASWIGVHMLATDQAPPVIFLGSQQISSNDTIGLLSRTT